MLNSNNISSRSFQTLWNRAIILFLSGSLLFSCAEKTHITADKDEGNKIISSKDKITPRRAEVLFLGHSSDHHPSRKYAPWLATALFKNGINITYTEEREDLNTENLNKYDGLVIYANHDYLAPEQEKAMRQFVESGKGLI